MTNFNQTIANPEILNAIEKRDEDFDASIVNATNSFKEKTQKLDADYPGNQFSINGEKHPYFDSLRSIRENFYAELADLIATKKVSRGILKFSIENCDPVVSYGIYLHAAIHKTLPNFRTSLLWINNGSEFLKAEFDFSLTNKQ
jgi:hypothetical protein